MPDWTSIKTKLKETGVGPDIGAQPLPVTGGDISAAWRLGDIFIKTGPPDFADMYAAEAEGLEAIAKTGTVRVPDVVLKGRTDQTAYLALEWLEFDRPDALVERKLGEQLAKMHCATQDAFGWHRDNTIGLTPQHNTENDDWVDFFKEQRLGYQLRLAAANGFTGQLQDQGEQLMERLPGYFDGTDVSPSLLHGDLWGGNWKSRGGEPVVFDPAVYFGDRETDLAMTRLFGGFGESFYDAYEASWPLSPGHRQRQDLYQLYHLLNHLNLFGSAYLGRSLALMRKLL